MQLSISEMASELIDAGDLIPKGEGFYEDMGGHIIHEDMVPDYFDDYVKRLDANERKELLQRINDI